MAEDAAAILARLAAATRASVEVRTDSGTAGTGAGAVEVVDEDGALVVTEAGEWTFGAGRPIRFRAASRWQAEGEALVVEQVRQGEPALIVLDRQPGGRWRAREAWPCGADRYEAAVEAGPDAVVVTWVISGPGKGSRIVTRYR